jgi:hypothetical protein
MAIYYGVRIVRGDLKQEVDGSTDLAAWVPIPEIPRLERCVIIDVALKLVHDRPPTGHVEPILVAGLLRH